MKRTISILLLVALIVTISLTSCTQDEIKDTSSDDTVSTIHPEGYVADDLPAVTFGGEHFNMLATQWYDATKFVYAEDYDGQLINDSLYEQRIKIQERFDVVITCEARGGENETADIVNNLVNSGEESYDIVYEQDANGMQNALNGCFYNLRQFDRLNFDKPWWTKTSDLLTVGGKLYFTGSYLGLGGADLGFVLTINKELAEQLQIEIPYEAAKAGEWYLEDLMVMIIGVTNDITGDGMQTEDDQWGFLTSYCGELCLQSSWGGDMLKKNSDGYLEMTSDVEGAVEVLQSIEILFTEGDHTYGAFNRYNYDVFEKGNSLFMLTQSFILVDEGKDLTFDIGILPLPKYDENQEEYLMGGFDLFWGMMKTVKESRVELVTTIIEALSCYNYNYVVPKQWDTILGGRVANTANDYEMFQIIRDAQYVDLTYAFFGHSTAATPLCYLLANTNSGSATSFIQQRFGYAKNYANSVNELYDEME